MERVRTSTAWASRCSRCRGCSAAPLRSTTALLIRKKPGEISQGGWGGTQGFWARSGVAEAARRQHRAATAGERMGSSGGRGRERERATGFEPATSSLGSWHSTPELRPRGCCYLTYTIGLAV